MMMWKGETVIPTRKTPKKCSWRWIDFQSIIYKLFNSNFRQMKKINFKLFFTVLAVVFVCSYLLGVLRWQWEFASVVYGILNVPFGALFILLEKYFWIELGPSHWVNDEITNTLFWGISVVFQAVLYYYIIFRYFRFKQK